MATVTRTALIDDLDGSDAEVTVALTIDGKRYRVDLSKANHGEWIVPLIKAASASNGPAAANKSSKPASRAPAARKPTRATTYARLSARDQRAIRAQLKRPRGRIADDAVETWKAAGRRAG